MKRTNFSTDLPAPKQEFVISAESVRKVKSEGISEGEEPVGLKMLIDEVIETLRSIAEKTKKL